MKWEDATQSTQPPEIPPIPDLCSEKPRYGTAMKVTNPKKTLTWHTQVGHSVRKVPIYLPDFKSILDK
jgi:hypothetical protein